MTTPQNPHSETEPAYLDPKDLFAFLAKHDEYPVSGQWLAKQAAEDGARPELIQFFEAIPLTFNSESEVVEHALKPEQLPYGKTLDITGGSEKPPHIDKADATLNISDIVPDS